MVFALDLRGLVDPTALEWAINKVVGRHGALRSKFIETDGRPRLVVLDRLDVPLRQEDLAEGEPALRERLRAENELGFDLERGPMLRTTLLRVAPEQHVLLFAAHHIVFDGHSVEVLLQEIGDFYRDPDYEAPAAGQFEDFARSEWEWLESTEGGEALEFWRENLAGAQQPALPADHRSAISNSIAAARVDREVPAAAVAGLQELLTTERVTPFMLMHAVYHLVLAASSGQRDTVVGSPAAVREGLMQDAIGYFVNMVAIRVDSTADVTFRDLLRRVRGGLIDVLEHQNYPYPQVVAKVRPGIEGRRSTFFDSVLSIEFAVSRPKGWPGLDVTLIDTEPVTAQFNVAVSTWWSDEAVGVTMVYREALYGRPFVTAMARHFVDILVRAVADPDLALDALVGKELSDAGASEVEAFAPAPPAQVGPFRGREPRNTMEEVLCQLFCEVIGVETVTIDDDFFELGGHSMLAGRMASRIRAVLGVECAVHHVFEAPTVAELSGLMLQGRVGDSFAPLLPLRAGGTRQPVFFLPPIGGLGWSYARFLPYIPKGHPVYAFQTTLLTFASGRPNTLGELARTFWEQIVERCPEGPLALVGWSFGGVLAQEVAVVAEESGGEVSHLVLLDSVPAKCDGMTVTATASESSNAIRESIQGSVGIGSRDMDETVLRDQTKVAEYCLDLLSRHSSRAYGGNVVSFETRDSGLTRAQVGVGWSSLTAGHTEFFPLDCLHEEVMDTNTVAVTGPILRKLLRG